MQVKVGTFPPDLAREFAELFTSAGIRVELKQYFEVSLTNVGHAEGKLSELKERLKNTEFEGEVERWEEYINAAREILSGGITVNEFKDAFVTRFAGAEEPDWENVLDKNVRTIAEEKGVEFDELDDEEKEEIIDEALRRSRGEILEFARISARRLMYSSIADRIIEMLETDGEKARLPDDPEIVLTLRDIDVDEAEKLGIDVKLEVVVEKMCDIYASAIDGMYEREKLLKLCDELDHAFELLIMADILAASYRHVKENGKMNVQDFVESLSNFQLGDVAEVEIETEAAEEILRVLEKEKLVKVKKGKVKAA